MFNTNIPATTPETLSTDITAADIVVVDIWAPWCAPCKALAPQFVKLAESNPDVKFFGLDAEAHKEFVKTQGVGTVPTVRVFHKGERVQQYQGPAAAMQLAGFLKTLKAA